jgi:hypothetical protein
VLVFVSDLMVTTAFNVPCCVMDFRYHYLSSETPVIYMSCSDGGIVLLKLVTSPTSPVLRKPMLDDVSSVLLWWHQMKVTQRGR